MPITASRVIIVGIVVVVAAAMAALNVSVSAWHATTAAKVAKLQTAAAPKPAHFAPALMEPVPPPVARYFKRTLREAQPLIVSARATQNAEFFVNGAWRPLTAHQHFTVMPPGFVWDARIQMAPLLPAQVRDAYVAGQGSMQATIFGVYSLVDLTGGGELNSGALQRYLGEAVWFPTALLPGAVAWSGVDDRTAIATLADGDTTVSLQFRFDDQDRIVEISGDRFAEHNGGYTLKPWRIVCSEHAQHMGIEIPEFCEVMWMGLQGPEPYWRGRITSIVYGFD